MKTAVFGKASVSGRDSSCCVRTNINSSNTNSATGGKTWHGKRPTWLSHDVMLKKINQKGRKEKWSYDRKVSLTLNTEKNVITYKHLYKNSKMSYKQCRFIRKRLCRFVKLPHEDD